MEISDLVCAECGHSETDHEVKYDSSVRAEWFECCVPACDCSVTWLQHEWVPRFETWFLMLLVRTWYNRLMMKHWLRRALLESSWGPVHGREVHGREVHGLIQFIEPRWKD